MTTKLKGFREINPWELDENAFKVIGKDYMEIVMGEAAHDAKSANAMTAAWGGFGVMWNLPVVFVVVRGEEYRYSRHILDEQPLFSLCFLDDEQKAAKNYLGTAHGWDDPNKIESAGLSVGWCGTELEHNAQVGIGEHVHTPFIEESRLVLVCEKILVQELPEESFLDPAIWEKWYTKQGQHCLYIARIHAAFARE